MTRPTCETCRFWDRFGDNAEDREEGFCRRYAPRPIQLPTYEFESVEYTVSPPRTLRHEWCGEHQRRPEGTPDGH